VLEEYKIPWRIWGTRNFHSIDELMGYLATDRVLFKKNGNGLHLPVTLEVSVAVVLVGYEDLELYEDKKVRISNGEVLRRPDFNGVGETMRSWETTDQVPAERCLAEELDFCDPTFYSLSKMVESYELQPRQSEKWPGLMAVYRRHIYECRIAPQLFRDEGYVVPDEDWINYFRWCKKTKPWPSEEAVP
jgi:hypothetical protein